MVFEGVVRQPTREARWRSGRRLEIRSAQQAEGEERGMAGHCTVHTVPQSTNFSAWALVNPAHRGTGGCRHTQRSDGSVHLPLFHYHGGLFRAEMQCTPRDRLGKEDQSTVRKTHNYPASENANMTSKVGLEEKIVIVGIPGREGRGIPPLLTLEGQEDRKTSVRCVCVYVG